MSIHSVLFERASSPIVVYDARTLRFLAANDAALALAGRSRDELLALTFADLRRRAEPAQSPAGEPAAADTACEAGAVWLYHHPDGSPRHVKIAANLPLEYEGRPAVLAVYLDATAYNHRMVQLQAYQELLQGAQELAELGTLIVDLRDEVHRLGGTLVRAYGRSEFPLAEARAEMQRVWHPQEGAELRKVLAALERREPYEGEYRMIVDGKERWFHGRVKALRGRDGAPLGMIGVSVDITERKRESERLRALAFGDAATGLPNHAALLERQEPVGALVLVRVQWSAVERRQSYDLRARDARAVAAVLRELAPASAMLARYGDETFAIALPPGRRVRVPLPLAKRIVTAFERPVSCGEDELLVVPAVGIAVAEAGAELPELARRAEAALYEAQRAESRTAVYTAELDRVRDRRAKIEHSLRTALDEHRTSIAYQPIISLRTGRVVSAEALMRWNCPGIGLVPPSEFIEIAEESGTIVRLGEWILREACAQNRRWQLEGLGPIRITVNVSVRQLKQSEFLRLVSSICESTGLDPSFVELEVSELIAVERGGQAMRNLEALRRFGVRIAVDDFGTGYSALSYLATLPLDTLKLDRTFIAPLGHDEFQAQLTAAVIDLAHGRGLTVVGEGVESSAQLDCLRDAGCDQVQGYLLGRPASADDLAALLRRERLS